MDHFLQVKISGPRGLLKSFKHPFLKLFVWDLIISVDYKVNFKGTFKYHTKAL